MKVGSKKLAKSRGVAFFAATPPEAFCMDLRFSSQRARVKKVDAVVNSFANYRAELAIILSQRSLVISDTWPVRISFISVTSMPSVVW